MNAHFATVMRILLPVLCGVLAAAPAFAQTPDLSEVSIEDLMNIQVTSASRKEQRAEDVASALFVITSDDIHRSGMTTVPDLLRLAPGVQVAQINATKWAVSVRGFNSLYANKLLVLVDGRSIYNRLFSGVYWDTGDVMLDDIDRIEVIRGPGAAIWGANAVNGVINIVTKGSSQTKGGLVRVESGRAGTQGAARYGGTLGAASYRLYTQWTGREASLIAPDTRADDWSRNVTAGFRSDWSTAPDTLMVEGAVTVSQARGLWPNLDARTAALEPTSPDLSDTQSGHVVARWTHTRAAGASLQIQSFVDIQSRDEPPGRYDRRTVDVDAQYHTALGARHDLVGGAAYRLSSDTFAGHGFLLRPPGNTSSLVTAFLQDEIALLGDRLTVTLGSQVQHDSYSGAGVQPSARAMWKAGSRQRLWAAASRALRTPALYERGLFYELMPAPSASGLPVVVTVVGNAALEAEVLADIEAGYRLDVGTDASIAVTGFAGRYDRLRTSEPGAPVVQLSPTPRVLVTTQFGNALDATTRGLEISGVWKPVPVWRLDGSYTAFAVTPRLAAGSLDPDAAREDGSAPRTQWTVRSSLTPVPRAKIDVGIFHVGALERYQVAAYTRADVNAEWRFTSGLSAMLIGQNLLDAAHKEFGAGAGSFVLETQVPRGVSLRLRWTFR